MEGGEGVVEVSDGLGGGRLGCGSVFGCGVAFEGVEVGAGEGGASLGGLVGVSARGGGVGEGACRDGRDRGGAC